MVWILVLYFTGCVTLGNLLNVCETQLESLGNDDYMKQYLQSAEHSNGT